ncbi:outer membrane autotransporter protein, partial [Sphingomonas sp. UYAg733]
GTTGIEATNSGTGATTVTANGTITGTVAEGINAIGNDAVTVSVADTVTGATRGLTLIGGTGGTGNISVTGAGGFVGGTGDAANILNNGAGTVVVDIAGASSSTDARGIVVRDTALGGDISVTTGAVTALTAGQNAIDVRTASTTADVTVVTNGDIQAGNAGIVAAVFPAAATGNVDVTTNGAVNGRFGIDAENFGSGRTNVTTIGPVNATTGNGIFALSTGGDVTVNAGDVTSTGNTAIIAQQVSAVDAGAIDVTVGNVSGTTGIFALNLGTGATTVTANGTVTGTVAEGINVNGGGAVTVNVADTVTGATTGLLLTGGSLGAGDINVTGAGGFVGGTGNAATIQNNGSGNVLVDISGASSSAGGEGIVVRDTALGGDINVTTGAVTALTAGQNAIDVRTASTTADVTVVTNGNIRAGNAGIVAAVLPAAATGNVNVTANGAVNGRFGIDAGNSGSGSTSVTTIGPVNATTGNGIFALSNGGNIVVTTGDVTSTGNTAIIAQNVLGAANTGTIDVTLTAGHTVTANTPTAFGIFTDSGQSSGTTTINVNGTIHAGAAGVASISTVGNITTNISAAGVIDPLIGIDQSTVSGAITVNNAGLVEGDNIGVRLTSTGVGAVGALTVNQVGSGRIAGIIGVDLASVDAALAVNNAGSISGTAGIRMTATGTGSATIVNGGTLAGTAAAVMATLHGGSFTLTNTGTLNGALNVTGSAVATSTVTNAAGAIANFGSGASSVSGSFVNAGTANIGAGGTVLFLGNTNNSNRINFAGAGTFTTNGAMTNTGIINAQNNLTSNVVTVGGAYTGGGQFFADYSTVTATADRLNIGGTASGNTNVTLNRVGARSFVAGGFLPVVTVTPGAAVNTFTSNTIFPNTGFILESFGRNPASNTQFGLIQQINPSSAALGSLTYVAESASMLLDEPISPYVTSRTDAASGDKKFSLWMRGSGGHTRQTIASSFTGGGISVNSVDRIRTDHQAIQLGGDLGLYINGGWKVHLGITGGWYDGVAHPSASERLAVDTSFVGGYVAISNGALTIDGQIRREWRNYDVVLPTLFGNTKKDIDGKATAGSVHASYRVGGGGGGFAATPFVGFNYADSHIDSLSIDADSFYAPGDDKTKVGQAGLRLSYRAGSEDKIVVEPFVSASGLKNWSRGSSGTFTFGAPATSFSLASRTWDDAMRYSAGVMGHARGGRLSAFVVGNIDDGSGLRAFTVNGGIRFNF